MADAPKPPDAPKRELSIHLDDKIALGAYANLTLVNHTETEFVLDFAFVQPIDPRAKVVSRIVSSPQHAKRLLLALQENVTRYETRFGPIRLAVEPPPGTPNVH